eukprot:TRINITY_DN5277_c0_g1_i1.p1 TRINITY_DN5277_c0_g1~~TRINITY_DN5277_c0_g1_i1.p1  ORF type:complete len:535 (-),score=81.07 TRINITY_DN5277_c0_g1_i1:543-2147(-)
MLSRRIVKTLSAITSAGVIAYGATQFYKSQIQTNLASPPPQVSKTLTRREHLETLKSNIEYDLLVIGGGATGVGVALDAATRGLKVALVEKEDFAAGTSSKSTKLIHGGVRYLEKAFMNLDFEQFALVKEGLEERGRFLKNCPHLTNKIPIMLPLHKWWQLPYYWVGIKAYDLISGSIGKLESSYLLSKSKALDEFPMLKSDTLKGAIVYYDGQQNDTRTNVMLACTAAAYGATIANHTEVINLTKNSSNVVNGAVVRDRISGEEITVKAKGVVNAAGPFIDKIRKFDDPKAEDMVVPSSGVHIVLPNYYSPQRMGLLDPSTSDGRVIFFLPWQNNTIAGTTDSPTELTDNPKPMEEEIHFILKEISRYLCEDIHVRRGDVLAAWSGIRPLVKDLSNTSGKKTQSLSRRHVLLVSDSKLLTIAGGKWTIFRRMAEDTVDKAIEVFDLKPTSKECLTRDLKIIGGENYSPLLFVKLIQNYGIDKRVAEHLIRSYGDRAFEVAKLGSPTGKHWPVLGVRLSPSYFFIDAEVRYAGK